MAQGIAKTSSAVGLGAFWFGIQHERCDLFFRSIARQHARHGRPSLLLPFDCRLRAFLYSGNPRRVSPALSAYLSYRRRFFLFPAAKTGKLTHFSLPYICIHFTNQFDANPYLGGVKKNVRMFRTGIMPYSAEEMLEPIFILHALNRSYQICRKKKIRRLTK